MLNIHFSEKGLGLVSLPHFAYDFSQKIIGHSILDTLTSHILLTDQILLYDCLYFSSY